MTDWLGLLGAFGLSAWLAAPVAVLFWRCARKRRPRTVEDWRDFNFVENVVYRAGKGWEGTGRWKEEEKRQDVEQEKQRSRERAAMKMAQHVTTEGEWIRLARAMANDVEGQDGR